MDFQDFFLPQMTYYQDFFKIVIRDDLGNE